MLHVTAKLLVALVLIATALGCTGTRTLPPEEAADPADKAALVEANNAFALDLYGKLRGREGNLILSPSSISTALAMTYAGARGQTETEMATVLHFPAGWEQAQVHRSYGAALRDLEARTQASGCQLRIANSLWGQKGYGFLESFLSTTRKNYGAGLNEVDFAGAPDQARQTINDWVAKQTQDKIRDLIEPGSFSPATTLVLTNAIYFKGDWVRTFNEKATRKQPFQVRADRNVEVPMMHQAGDYEYHDGESFQALALPYQGKELSMVILLPRERDGLAELEKSLTPANLTRWIGRLQTQKGNVALPRFKLTSKFKLNKELPEMGMTSAFGSAADFSGMNGKRDLFLADVVHQAFVDVNEQGTEAAGATYIEVAKSDASTPSERIFYFTADHPFLFLIRDNSTGSILFLGRLVDPGA